MELGQQGLCLGLPHGIYLLRTKLFLPGSPLHVIEPLYIAQCNISTSGLTVSALGLDDIMKLSPYMGPAPKVHNIRINIQKVISTVAVCLNITLVAGKKWRCYVPASALGWYS